MFELAPFFALMAAVVGVVYTVPYVRDTLRRTTAPHRGSWLIWSVIEVVAVASQGADGARWSLVALASQAACTCWVFALSIRFGSGGISRGDLTLLALAGVGVAGWLVSDEPVIATAFVIVADLVAALMMVPKTWRDPHSETLSTFVLASVCGALTAGAVGVWSAPLLIYPVYFILVNAGISAVIIQRRRMLARESVGDWAPPKWSTLAMARSAAAQQGGG